MRRVHRRRPRRYSLPPLDRRPAWHRSRASFGPSPTQPRAATSFAAESISLAGFEEFAPRLRTRVGAKCAPARFSSASSVSGVSSSGRPALLSVVKFWPAPVHCPDAEVAKLIDAGRPRTGPCASRAARRAGSAYPRAWRQGDDCGRAVPRLRGDSHRNVGARPRVLINLLGRRTTVAVPTGLVVPAQGGGMA